MNHLFEVETASRIIARLNQLQPTSTPLWGKMNVSQMLAHCQAPMQVYFGDLKLRRGLIGILFGKMAKKSLFTDKPWKKGLPTAKEFVVADARDFEMERSTLIGLIQRFNNEGPGLPDSPHPFFGKMTANEWAMLGYKHMDHHLRQFGV